MLAFLQVKKKDRKVLKKKKKPKMTQWKTVNILK